MKSFLQRKAKTNYEKPTLKIFSTVVPKVFEEKFKDWDKSLASKNLIKI